MASNHHDIINCDESTRLIQTQAEDSIIKNDKTVTVTEKETDNNEIGKDSYSENTEMDIGIIRSSTYKSCIGKYNKIIYLICCTATLYAVVRPIYRPDYIQYIFTGCFTDSKLLKTLITPLIFGPSL